MSAKWSEQDIKTLKEFYLDNSSSIEELSVILGRTINSIRSKASKLGLKKASTALWSDNDISTLKSLYGNTTIKNISNTIHRSEKAISHKITELKIATNLWSKEELSQLRDLVLDTSKSIETISKMLNRSTSAIRGKIRAENLSLPVRADGKNYLNFYLIKCIDTDGTNFYKIGWTSKDNISERFNGNRYEVLLIYRSNRSTIQKFENFIKNNIVILYKYKPINRLFYSEGHSGYTECFKPEISMVDIMFLCLQNMDDTFDGKF